MSSIYKGLLRKVERKIEIPLIARILTLLLVIPITVKYWLDARKLQVEKKVQQRNDVICNLNKLCAKPQAQLDSPLSQRDARIDISVIIPVYNVEKFLRASVISVMSQETNAKIEVICINDGATDGSAAILSDLEATYPNLKVVSQKNAGLSAARNTGIEIALGRYFMFLDSDDILLSGAIETAFRLITETKSDIVIGAYKTFVTNDEITKFVLNNKKSYEVSELSDIRDGYAWGKLYARELFSTVRYPKGYQFEDTITKPLIYRLAKKIVITETAFVAYRINANSLTVKQNKDKFAAIHMLWLVELVSDYYCHLKLPKDAYFNNFVIEHFTRVLVMRSANMPAETISLVFEYLRDKAFELKQTAPGNSFQDRAWQAVVNGDIRKWFFYSKMAVLGHYS